MGFKLGKQLLFPAMPKSLRDIWVLFELAVTILQFVVACIYTSFRTNIAYNVSFVVLSIFSVILALIDTFIYFHTLGSCRQCVKAYKNRSLEKEGADNISGFATDKTENHMSLSSGESKTSKAVPKSKTKRDKFKKGLNESFEIIRNVVSELLIYPLLIFDLLEIAGSSQLQLNNTETILNFALFIISTFFLIISVYIVRFVILSITMLQLNRIPVTCLRKQDHVLVITRFLIHVVLQICVHMFCIVAVGVKIQQENRNNTTDFYIVSPFLWYVIVAGWLIPILGVINYFFVKYYWFKDFSAGLYLDMMSLLQTQGFAEAVFHGKAKDTAKETSKKFLEKIDYISTKVKFEERQDKGSIVYKFLYPLKIPIFFLFGTLYVLILIAFCACLLLTNDGMGGFRVSAFDGGSISVALFLAIVFVFIGNLHVVTVVMLWLLLAAILLCLLVVGVVLLLLLLPFLPCIGHTLYKHRSKLRLPRMVHVSVQ